jgi:hypothetical protein
MSSVQQTSGGGSSEETPSPKVVKKMEKEINKEAKHEEQNVKGVVKDLAKTQKAEGKAQKVQILCFREFMLVFLT